MSVTREGYRSPESLELYRASFTYLALQAFLEFGLNGSMEEVVKPTAEKRREGVIFALARRILQKY